MQRSPPVLINVIPGPIYFRVRRTVATPLWVCVLLSIYFPSLTLAHNTSVTHIEMKVDGANLTVSLGLNQSDLLEHALQVEHSSGHFADRRDLEDAAPAILKYVSDGLLVTADGKPLSAPTAIDWPPQHAELTHIDAGGLEVPSAIPMTLRYALPGGAKHIELTPRLFSAPNFAAIFDVSVYPPGGAEADRDRHR